MENNIELFDLYINGELGAAEKQAFDERIASDRAFRSDFRIYLFALKGMCQEVEQENIEFGHAVRNMSKEDLLRIIGHSSQPRIIRPYFFRERMAWVASLAAVLVVAVFAVFNIRQSAMDKLDDTIVAYNYIPDTDRGGNDMGLKDIASLEKAYRTATPDDIQAQQDAGMRLAMAYLKEHDRKKAREILNELKLRFADDEEFAAQCQRIINQLQ